MATGSRTEIVLSVGFRLGNLARLACDQSKYSVESAPAPIEDQNSNSSASLWNSGIAFFTLIEYRSVSHRPREGTLLHETFQQVIMFHETGTNMRSVVTDRVRKHREALRAAGLRSVQIWLPDTRSESFRRKCERECLSLAADPHEAKILAWIAEVADTDGWA
jgi:hypothetical protein